MPSANQRISEYVLEELVGRGSFGEVWRARHHVWADQLVAIKIPTDGQYIRNLQREGAAIHGLDHINIVHARGFDPYADPPYLDGVRAGEQSSPAHRGENTQHRRLRCDHEAGAGRAGACSQERDHSPRYQTRKYSD